MKRAEISLVRSVEPVSTTIISSTAPVMLSRQRARTCSSFFTIHGDCD
ncbi:MAG TPA: hypothetical protein VNL35_16230 [Chloroflexota bacterium]|nr:hypothetical protein [Chloroflexota bacterium]